MSAQEIARKFRVSERTIFHKRARLKALEQAGMPLDGARSSRKQLNLKKARARERRAGRRQERVSLRQDVMQGQANDDA
jgi:predicted DNA-binding transcriptional regulator YafY